jgi:hypothetical protein
MTDDLVLGEGDVEGCFTVRCREVTMPALAEGQKRYHLVMPEELFREIERAAEARHTTTVEFIRRLLRIGLLVDRIQDSPGAALVIREGDKEREVLLY